MFYNKMITEKTQIEKEISRITKDLANLPKENLICAKNGTGCKWYISTNNKPVYLPKSEHDYAEKLAVKKYLTLQLKDLNNELA